MVAASVAGFLVVVLGLAAMMNKRAPSGAGPSAHLESRYNAPVINSDSPASNFNAPPVDLSGNGPASNANTPPRNRDWPEEFTNHANAPRVNHSGSSSSNSSSNTNRPRSPFSNSGSSSSNNSGRNNPPPRDPGPSSNSGGPAVGDTAGDEDPTESFRNPDKATVQIDAMTKKAVQDLGTRMLQSICGGAPFQHSSVYNFDRQFWEALRRVPDKLRRDYEKDMRAEMGLFRINQQANLEDARRTTELKFKRADLHSVSQLAGRPELITYWRMFDEFGSMWRYAMWMIREKAGSWKVYDIMDVETNRRDSWEIADRMMRTSTAQGQAKWDGLITQVNALFAKQPDEARPQEYDRFIAEPLLGFYRDYLRYTKLVCMINQNEPDDKAIRRYADQLVADEDSPELTRMQYGMYLYSVGEYPAAIQQLQTFIDRLGPDDDTSSYLGLCYEESSPPQLAKARKVYQDWIAVEWKPGSCFAHVVRLDIKEGKYSSAIDGVKKMIAEASHPEILRDVCLSYCDVGAWEELKKALDLISAKHLPFQFYFEGRALLGIGQYDDAIKQLTLARSLAKKDKDQETDGSCQLLIAACHSQKGDTSTALRLAMAARSEAGVGYSSAWSAVFMAKAGKWDEAMDFVEKSQEDGAAVFVYTEAVRSRVGGGRELWEHEQIGPFLQDWYQQMMGKAYELPEK